MGSFSSSEKGLIHLFCESLSHIPLIYYATRMNCTRTVTEKEKSEVQLLIRILEETYLLISCVTCHNSEKFSKRKKKVDMSLMLARQYKYDAVFCSFGFISNRKNEVLSFGCRCCSHCWCFCSHGTIGIRSH